MAPTRGAWGRKRLAHFSREAGWSGNIDKPKPRKDEARLHYQQTALTAFREVSDALVLRERLAEIREQQAREVKALERAVRVSTERYLAGKASYYEVLEAQQQLFPSELNLARTQRDQLLAVVALYKALGGGWVEEVSRPSACVSLITNRRRGLEVFIKSDADIFAEMLPVSRNQRPVTKSGVSIHPSVLSTSCAIFLNFICYICFSVPLAAQTNVVPGSPSAEIISWS